VRKQLRLSEPEFIELARSTLKAGTSFQFRTSGSSMYPFIKDGDVITVAPLPPKAPSLGDVLVFIHEQARRLFVHRVTKRDGGFYVTRGDSAHFDDGMISRTNLLGYVTRVERNGKKIRLGLGPERSMIALLARTGLLSPLVFRAWCCMRLFLT
jgi:signal peptidase I